MKVKTIFAFDLDGTVTDSEILPRLAREAGIFTEIAELTRRTLAGDIDFEESFRLRFAMLRHLPLETVQKVVAATPLNADICEFITKNRASCCVVTGNLDAWVEPITQRLACRFFSSSSKRTAEGLLALRMVLRKDEAIKKLTQGTNTRVVAIGESVNDIAMFKAAHIGVAYAGVHRPAPGLLSVARHLAEDGKSLCRLLENLKTTSLSKPQ